MIPVGDLLGVVRMSLLLPGMWLTTCLLSMVIGLGISAIVTV